MMNDGLISLKHPSLIFTCLLPLGDSRGLLSLLGLVASELRLRINLDRSLGSTNGRDAFYGGRSQVASVATFSGEIGDSLIGPI